MSTCRSLMLVLAASFVGCALYADEVPSEPSFINLKLVDELFPECTDALEECLDDPEMFLELEDAGVFTEPDDEDLSAAYETWRVSVSGSCRTLSGGAKRVRNLCARGGANGTFGIYGARKCGKWKYRRFEGTCAK